MSSNNNHEKQDEDTRVIKFAELLVPANMVLSSLSTCSSKDIRRELSSLSIKCAEAETPEITLPVAQAKQSYSILKQAEDHDLLFRLMMDHEKQ